MGDDRSSGVGRFFCGGWCDSTSLPRKPQMELEAVRVNC